VVGNFAPGSKEATAFNKVASNLNKDFLFGQLESPGVIMYKKFDEGFVTFKGDLTSEEELTKFIQKESIPLMDEIGPNNYMRYYETKVPLAFLFWSDKKAHRSDVGSKVEEALKAYRGKLNAVYINAETYGGHADRLNVEKKWPALVIHDIENDEKYPFSGKEFSKELISSFFDDFTKGVLQPKTKSEPAPEKNDGPVIEIVNETFNKIVGDNSKDVLVEYYTDWCGYCKKLAPTYEKIATAYTKAKGGDKVVIAKFNPTKNDIPAEYGKKSGFNLEGFPTIVLYKANSANQKGVKSPTIFEGDNSESEIIKFLNENLSNKVTIDVPEPEGETVKEEL
jgi:protein disulfide-isomerase A1